VPHLKRKADSYLIGTMLAIHSYTDMSDKKSEKVIELLVSASKKNKSVVEAWN